MLTAAQWRLQDFFCWGAKRGLNSSKGVLKKRIQLRESNERLTLAISFFIYSSFEKDIFYFFVVLNFSFATVITQLLHQN